MRTKEHQRLPEVLQTVSGVRIVRGAGGRYLATGGGRAGYGFTTSRSAGPSGPAPRACYVVIYLDGLRLTTVPSLDDIPVNQIMAMEFYRSASEMPVELNAIGSACGVLAIWTRDGSGK